MATLPSILDYTTAIQTPALVKASQLQGGHPELYNDRVVKYSGGFCVVFPYSVNNSKYAVRCWHASIAKAEERTKIIAGYLDQVKLPYFVGFDYVDNGIVTAEGPQPIVVMDWVNAKPLKQYINAHLRESDKLKDLADSFLQMVKDLHKNHISHGDLQHGNIMVKDDGSIVLVDYDSMYVPQLAGWSDDISGLEGYQHPSRWDNKTLTPKADYFSEVIIYSSIKALEKAPALWNDLQMEDTDTMLFNAEDIKSGGSSNIFGVLESLPDCEVLSKTIKRFLSCATIDELQPLEDVLVNPVDGLRRKWQDNGYKDKPKYSHEEVDRIRKQWEIHK